MAEHIKPIYGLRQYPHMDFIWPNNPIMDIAKTIGTNLTALMEGPQGLDTCKKVAARSGVGFGTVQRAKNGDANITVEKLTLIAKAFHRHPAELMIEQQSTLVPAISDYSKTIDGSATRIDANEPIAKPILLDVPKKTKRELRIEAINNWLEATDEDGLLIMLHEAEKTSEKYPLAKQTPASSQ